MVVKVLNLLFISTYVVFTYLHGSLLVEVLDTIMMAKYNDSKILTSSLLTF